MARMGLAVLWRKRHRTPIMTALGILISLLISISEPARATIPSNGMAIEMEAVRTKLYEISESVRFARVALEYVKNEACLMDRLVGQEFDT